MTVVRARSGREAVGAPTISSWQPDVIVTDVGMPGRDGYALLRDIRALPDASVRDVPAIALTAYTSGDDAAEARAAGFEVHLSKPVEPAQLVAIVSSLDSRGRGDAVG